MTKLTDYITLPRAEVEALSAKWRNEAFECTAMRERLYCADELSHLLASARGVVVGDDDDGMPFGYADWYNRTFHGRPVDTSRDYYCEIAWRAAIDAALEGKS